MDRDLTYEIHYAGNTTRDYKVNVFDYPDLKQADAKLKFPEYTGLKETTVQDTRLVTAVTSPATARPRIKNP